VGGTQPSWRAMPRSSRLAQCSMIRPPAIRNQCDWVMAKALFVGGKIAMFAAGLAQRQAASARVQILIRDGRHVDDSLAPVWDKLTDEGLTGMTMLGRHLLETGQLRDGIGLDEVRDVLWNYLAIDAYERLVLTQGWPLERYSAWLAHALTSALCP
jgi:hypothetical protein